MMSWKVFLLIFHGVPLFSMVSTCFLWFSDSCLCYGYIALVLSLVFVWSLIDLQCFLMLCVGFQNLFMVENMICMCISALSSCFWHGFALVCLVCLCSWCACNWFSHFHCFPAPAMTDFCCCFTVFWCLLLSWRDTFHNFHCFLLFPMVSNGFLWFSDSYLCYCQIALVLSLVFFVVFH